MAINAQNAYLAVEQTFADLVAAKVREIEVDLDSTIQNLSTTRLFNKGFLYTARVRLTDEEQEELSRDDQHELVSDVIDGVVNLYEEQGWVVCVTDTPKLTSHPIERWTHDLLIKYIGQ